LLLLTGQRRDELAEARWREFDLDRALWTLPRERMKNDKAHIVHLAPLAKGILAQLPLRELEVGEHEGRRYRREVLKCLGSSRGRTSKNYRALPQGNSHGQPAAMHRKPDRFGKDRYCRADHGRCYGKTAPGYVPGAPARIDQTD
jgi:integrase